MVNLIVLINKNEVKIFMSYVDEIFMRADIQQICAFLLYGTEGDIDPHSHVERLETAKKQWAAKLRERYLDQTEYEEIGNLIFEYSDTIQSVYMEIGLQIGAILATQVCKNIKKSF